MRISELGRRSGLPVATIKFYLREGLLPAGARTARNQAEYDETHLVRLRLIQTLTGVGRLSLASVREVLAAVDDRNMSVNGKCAVLNRALLPSPDLGGNGKAEGELARAQVDRFIDTLGWRIPGDAQARTAMAQVLVVLRQLDGDFTMDFFAPYADVVCRLSAYDLAGRTASGSSDQMAIEWVARVVLFEAGLAAMRGLAHEHHIAVHADEVRGSSGQ
ncbi:MerR family transcriptional regulator [Micromonospora sp. WMMD882]|uniref:MerR family transcriptional regulator n=1 Tax=Micromonospora sp. WMMD882 TaxID=3015151 RepID=UPI00248CD738|nr:MerR family transcriptional regulator [Micromonospora sp. WMMD882]WBB80698.1 MerR family transcriptional regulator [Micromonospora sp. WMMD882]